MSHSRPDLRLVPAPGEVAPRVRFCGHCGEAPPTPMAARSRVCALCGMGIVIEADQGVAPGPGDAFLLVDRRLVLCGLSRAAERLLGVAEPDAVDHRVDEFLEPADAEAGQADGLLSTILAAAGSDHVVRRMVLRPPGEYGVRYAARVGSCGPPAGALIALDDV